MSFKVLNLYKIKILAEVCKNNSYRIASKNLFITPSAVSKAIKSLELEWKLKLVESNGNTIKVTEDAKQLSALAAKLLQANDEFGNLLFELTRDKLLTPLRIGSGGSHSKIIMNKLLTNWLDSFPDLEYEVITGNSLDVSDLIDKGELDCGVISGRIPEYVDSYLLYNDNISLYAHYSHPLAGLQVSLKNFQFPICLREKGSSTRDYLESFIHENDIQFPYTKQTGKNEELTDHLCQTQNALQFMSDYYYNNSHWKKNYVKINCKEVVIPISIYFITKKGFPFKELILLAQNNMFQDENLAS